MVRVQNQSFYDVQCTTSQRCNICWIYVGRCMPIKDILLNIPMSLEFTFLALQNNHSSVLILRDSYSFLLKFSEMVDVI